MMYALLLLILVNVFFAYFCIKFAIIVVRVQDVIEESLEKIDKKYNRLGQIVKIPVFFDSPEIKSIMSEIIEVQDIVLEVALNLSSTISNTKDKLKDEENN